LSELSPGGGAEGKIKMRPMIEEDLSIAWGLEGEPLLLVAEHRIVPTEAAE
jgi:hypothetical protein